MEVTTGAKAASDSNHDLCVLARMLLNNLRSPLAAVRVGAELLARPDLSPLQSQRVARNVLVAAARLEEILSDVTLRLIEAGVRSSAKVAQLQPNVLEDHVDAQNADFRHYPIADGELEGDLAQWPDKSDRGF